MNTWQTITDESVRTGGIELARELWRNRKASWGIGPDWVETFLAIYHHCANNLPPMVERYDGEKPDNNAAAILFGRVKHRNRAGIRDNSWKWARERLRPQLLAHQVDTSDPEGF